MKISPLEIRQKTFEKNFRGYDKDEVDAYLQALSFEWERMNNDYRDVKEKLVIADRDVQKMREVESSLYKALKTAEDTGTNIVDQATKAAHLHLKEAQMDAEALMNEAKSQAKNMLEEAEDAVKSAVDQVKHDLQQVEQDYKLIENQRDNLLAELKAIANDSLEKATRYQDRFASAKFKLPKIEVNTENSFTSTFSEKPKHRTVLIEDETIEETPQATIVEEFVVIEKEIEQPTPILVEEPEEEITSFEFEVNTSYPNDDEDEIENELETPEVPNQEEIEPQDEQKPKDDRSSFFDQL